MTFWRVWPLLGVLVVVATSVGGCSVWSLLGAGLACDGDQACAP
jgi:hypothetical protein